MTLCGSRMLFQDIPFFYGWLSNKSSQLRIDFIGLENMVPIDAHFVSATMKIITTYSLNAPILKLMCIMGIIIHLVKLKLMCKRIQMVQ
jgi:hypothetical protein